MMFFSPHPFPTPQKVDSATGVAMEGEYDPNTGRLEVRNKASSKTYVSRNPWG